MRTMILVGATALAAAVALQASAQSGGQGSGQWQGGQGGQGRGQGQGQSGQTQGAQGQGGQTQGGQGRGGQSGGQSGGQQQQQQQQAQQKPPAPQPKPQPARNELTLYENPGFGGRQFTYYSASSEVYRQGYQTRSARAPGGVWTLCQSSDPRGPCQTVDGSAPSIGFNVGVVRPGRQEITLYEGANFSGRQFTYYGASDQVRLQGFQARSARTDGGAWAACEGQPGRSQCVTVNGSASNLNIQVSAVQPGQAPAYSGGGQGGYGGAGGGGNAQGGYGQGGQGGQWRQGGGYGALPQAGQRFQYTCESNMSLAATFADDGSTVKVRLQGRKNPVVLDRRQSTGAGRASASPAAMCSSRAPVRTPPMWNAACRPWSARAPTRKAACSRSMAPRGRGPSRSRRS